MPFIPGFERHSLLLSIIYREPISDMDIFSLLETKSHLCYMNSSQDRLISVLVSGSGNKTERVTLKVSCCLHDTTVGTRQAHVFLFSPKRTVSHHMMLIAMLSFAHRIGKCLFLDSVRRQILF